jgi:hypothetical protein
LFRACWKSIEREFQAFHSFQEKMKRKCAKRMPLKAEDPDIAGFVSGILKRRSGARWHAQVRPTLLNA